MAKKEDTFEDILIRHSAYVQRLIPSLSRDVIAIIDKNNPALRGEILEFLDKNEGINQLTQKYQNDLQVLRNKVQKYRGTAITEAQENYSVDMKVFAGKEQAYIAGGVSDLGGKTMALSSATALDKMVDRLPITGQTIPQMYKSLSANDTERIVKTVSDGLKNGLTRTQVENAIFGTKKMNYTDGVLETTRRSVNDRRNNSGITRTTINAIQNESHAMLYQANSDIIKSEMIVSVLDGRTTFYCASVDGDVYPLGVGPTPPFHYNCRTQRVPEIDGINIQSTRPYVEDTRTRRQREKDFRKESKEAGGDPVKVQRAKWKKKRIGLVPDDTKYTEWFDDASATFQKDYLGASRYKLWKKGGLNIGDFTDDFAKDYNLNQLYAQFPDAFKKAGLKAPK